MLHLKSLLAFGLFVGFYFLLSESFELLEIAVALGSSLIALLALNAVAVRSHAKYAIPRDWPMLGFASPLRVLKACIVVLGSILRAATASGPLGYFDKLPIPPSEEGSAGATRAALAEWAVSVAPDTYATILDGNTLVVHRALANDNAWRAVSGDA